MTQDPEGPRPSEGDLLTPWRAVDRLDSADAALFESLLGNDPRLARGLDLAAEERNATIEMNEALPASSVVGRDALFARIEAERSPSQRVSFGAWLGGWIQGLSTSALAWSATAAACVIMVQAGLLAMQIAPHQAQYETASEGSGLKSVGQKALIGFAPGATAQEIETLLRAGRAEIISGPRTGGIFEVLLKEARTEAELLAALERFRSRSSIVRVAIPAALAAP